MACLSPLDCFRAAKRSLSTGKYGITFDRRQANTALPMRVPCGQCAGCRLEKSRQWASRITLEAGLYSSNSFVTLTYSDEFLPRYGNLDYEAPVLFMKRLRKRFGDGIRSFGSAEYGEISGRPHYHLCLLNFEFPDLSRVEDSRTGGVQYESPILNSLWPFGRAVSSELNFETAAYTARYVLKKMSASPEKKLFMDELGEIHERPPDRSVCVSRRPGIGKPFLDRYGFSEVYNTDSVVLRGKELPPPKYFDKRFELDSPVEFAKLKLARAVSRKCCNFKYCLHWHSMPENASNRLFTRAEVARLKFEFYSGSSL